MLDKTGKDSSNYNAENIRLIQEASPFVGQWIEKEYERQKNNVELIASENYCSDAILAACGSCLSWKYAEGYPYERKSGNKGRYYGGTENVDAAIFADFDYTALGHIHNPQNIGENSAIRYCGTPLKYSFSEANRDKSVTVAELGQKGQLEVRQVPLEPLHEVRELRGSFQEIWQEPYSEDFLHIVLTDEEETPDALGKLRVRFPALLHLEYDNKRTRALGTVADGAQISSRAPSELFAEFYSLRNGQELTEEQSQFVESLIKEIWEGEE